MKRNTHKKLVFYLRRNLFDDDEFNTGEQENFFKM